VSLSDPHVDHHPPPHSHLFHHNGVVLVGHA
jgi:hypothetical protein